MEMTRFCNCNDKWDISAVRSWRSHRDDYQNVYNTSMHDICPWCRMYFWFSPIYEDMMWDLREMNLIW